MRTSESTANIAAALAAAQGAMKPVPLDGTNSHFGSRYATLAALWQTARPVLAAHGLSVLQGRGADGGIETIILHSSGEWIVLDGVPMRPVKDDPQGAASAITYARRYGFAAAVGLVADDDDDGNAATAGKASQGPQDAPKPPQVVGDAGARENPAYGGKSVNAGIADKAPCHLYGTMYSPATAAVVKTKARGDANTADFIFQHGDSFGPKYQVKAWGHAADDALAAPAGASVEIEGSWHVWKDQVSINAQEVRVTQAPESPAPEYTDDQIPF